MESRMTFKQVMISLIIVGVACFVGVWESKQLNQIQQLGDKLEAQEKIAWDIENKKMAEANTESVAHWEIVKMKVTAYCPCEICCEQWGKILVSSGKRKTSSGHTIHVGDKFVAAPRNYPFGTEMVIEGYAGGKIVKVEDVGGAIKDNKLDLYFDTHQEALNWGIKDVLVKVRVKVR